MATSTMYELRRAITQKLVIIFNKKENSVGMKNMHSLYNYILHPKNQRKNNKSNNNNNNKNKNKKQNQNQSKQTKTNNNKKRPL